MTRDVSVKIPARMMFSGGSDLGLARMIDPLAMSEISRLEEQVSELKKTVHELGSFRIEMESYKKVTEKLALELGILHKGMPFQSAPVEAQEVIKATASVFRIPLGTLLSRDRTPEASHARWAAWHVCNLTLLMGINCIAKTFKRDHATVTHGLRMLKAKIKKDTGLADLVRRVGQSVVQS